MSAVMSEDVEMKAASHLTPISETLIETASQSTPPSSRNAPIGRDIRFEYSNETLRDEFQTGRVGTAPPEGSYEVHCQSRPRKPQPVQQNESGWRRTVQNFTPSYVNHFPSLKWEQKLTGNATRWFSVIMGTGIVSTLLYTLPYNGRWIQWIAIAIFALNVVLFTAGCILSIIRYSMYPQTFKAALSHPVQSMFLGTFPMGLSMIIDMICLVCVPAWGIWVEYTAWSLWIFNVAVSVLCALSLPFLLYVHCYHGNHSPSPENMS